jgi:glycerol-3-phosphate acyltransferase PlsY
VLLLDLLKGTLPVLAAARIAPGLGGVLAATAAILGHCFSPWLGFKGGKGVATMLGALIALCWQAALICGLGWLAVVRLTRYSSVASMTACALSLPALWLLTGDPGKTLFGLGATLFIVWKHRENIRRLREGRENRLFAG